jgi:oligoendopeptidase F
MPRHFLPEDFKINSKEDVLPFFQLLIDREVNSAESMLIFLRDVSELEGTVGEDLAWRYIRMTCDTQNEEHEKSYLHFIQEIQPELAPLEDLLNQKIVNSTFTSELDNQEEYHIYLRGLKGAVELYCEENIPLQAEIQSLAQEYASIQGAMSIHFEDKEITMQQAANYLLKTDRTQRATVWDLMHKRRIEDTQKLEVLFDKMVKLRHQVALNAGFDNFRDYMFKSLGRYDYSVQDCLDFHSAIEKHVVPLLKELTEKRKQHLGLVTLKPWDLGVDIDGREPLKPFSDGKDLLEKSLDCLGEIDPFFKECLQTMKSEKLLDLESRIGKAPGGYNYPLAETNKPFIFMNASGNLRDVETLVHEAGHAVHSFLMAPLELNAFKNTPSEVAELASMSMELLSMDGWQYFLNDKTELNRAKLEQIEGIISTLPWIATVDAFQNWIYTHPNHSQSERSAKWLELGKRFGTGMIDYQGVEDALTYSWHKQLHIFEIPFYYIEYGFAQLGAIGMWRFYSQDAKQALKQYKDALKLGYTKSIPSVYLAAGIRFEFSDSYIKELFEFLGKQVASMQ